jgi:5-methylcytosine-specific restriction enzyme A
MKRDKRVCQLRIPNVCQFVASEADHVIPVAEGGDPYALWNGQAVCSACHAKKSSREGHKAQGHKVDDIPPF